MKKVFTSAFLLSLFAFANNSQIAQNLVRTEIEKYANEYQVTQIIDIHDLGIINKKYSFQVVYSKLFCSVLSSDTCALYKCQSLAQVDSDAVVDFESEPSASKCEKLN